MTNLSSLFYGQVPDELLFVTLTNLVLRVKAAKYFSAKTCGRYTTPFVYRPNNQQNLRSFVAQIPHKWIFGQWCSQKSTLLAENYIWYKANFFHDLKWVYLWIPAYGNIFKYFLVNLVVKNTSFKATNYNFVEGGVKSIKSIISLNI